MFLHLTQDRVKWLELLTHICQRSFSCSVGCSVGSVLLVPRHFAHEADTVPTELQAKLTGLNYTDNLILVLPHMLIHH